MCHQTIVADQANAADCAALPDHDAFHRRFVIVRRARDRPFSQCAARKSREAAASAWSWKPQPLRFGRSITGDIV